MKLILTFVSTDGCTYSCTETYPVEYESKAKFIDDFELAAIQAYMEKSSTFKFVNYTWDTLEWCQDNWTDNPEIYTFEEWFDKFLEN